jgi:hypothetical protein
LQKLSDPALDVLVIAVPVLRVGGSVVLKHDIRHRTPPERLVSVQPSDDLFAGSMLHAYLELIVSM